MYKKHFSRNCIFVSRLGSTECGGIRNYFVDKESLITDNNIPAGFPTDGLQVLLLDEESREVGSNEIGEIAIQSRYLSPGYWRQPELTQAMFLPGPEGGDQRIYLTGDMGYMLSDGCLFHLGRKDFQVKVRGYRVEVAEIEMTLQDLDCVKEAVVIGREAQANDVRLVAYVTLRGKELVAGEQLRRCLLEKLPDYMIPSTFVTLEGLPLTPNGKVDRLALPEPERERPSLESPFVAPRTTDEETLAAIWEEVLELDQVGIHDNFLHLGGDSLRATQVIARVFDAFQLNLSVRSLLEAATVADMALVILQSQAGKISVADLDRLLVELEVPSEE